MKYSHGLPVLGIVLCLGTTAFAQYGLYGSPEMLQLQQMTPQTAYQPAYPSTLINAYNARQPANYYQPQPTNYYAAPAVSPLPRPVAYLPADQAYTNPGGRPTKAPSIGHSPQFERPMSGPPSVVDGMLQEPGFRQPNSPQNNLGYGAGCGPGCGSSYGMGQSGGCGMGQSGCGMGQSGGYGMGCGSGYGAGYGQGGYGCNNGGGGDCCYTPLWYANASWMTLGRNLPNRVWTTYESGNDANQMTNFRDITLDWGFGGEFRIGRLFCCGNWALEGVFWGLSPITGASSTTHPSGVSTPFNFLFVDYANPAIAGLPAELFDNAEEHRLSRRNEFYNVELNMIRRRMMCDPCSPVGVNWLLGLRYFRFDENLQFTSLRGGGNWNNPTDVGLLEDRIVNSLIGVQVGVDLNYYCHTNLRLFVTPKFGIYNNQIENRFRAQRGDGERFAPEAGSGIVGNYPVSSSANSLAFLTEVSAGGEWQFSPRFSVRGGYRVMVATGIGLADNQFPPYVADIPEIAAIDYNGDLVLHGAFVGITFNF